jgi:predicted GNAT family acetyltransferase
MRAVVSVNGTGSASAGDSVLIRGCKGEEGRLARGRGRLRAGILTNTAIGKKYGISHTAVQKRAKAEGWTRDLSKRIEAAREAKVSRAIVSAKVSEQRAATDAQVVPTAGHRAVRSAIVGMRRNSARWRTASFRKPWNSCSTRSATSRVSGTRRRLRKAFDAALALSGRAAPARTSSLARHPDRQGAPGLRHRQGGEGPQSLGEFLESLK